MLCHHGTQPGYWMRGEVLAHPAGGTAAFRQGHRPYLEGVSYSGTPLCFSGGPPALSLK
jgi:hypothetical protein